MVERSSYGTSPRRPRTTALLLAACALLAVRPAAAQSYLLRVYSEDDGLPSSTVKDLAQDSEGRMWLATRSGIAVYDGTRVEVYDTGDGLPTLDYFKIAVGPAGGVWALTRASRSAVARFDGEPWSLLPELDLAAGHADAATSFAVTARRGEPMVAVGTLKLGWRIWNGDGWMRLDDEGGKLASVYALAAGGGRLYAGTPYGLAVVDVESLAVRFEEDFPAGLSPSVLGLAVDERPGGSRVWLLGPTWAGYSEGGRFELVARELEGLVTGEIGEIDVEPDAAGGLFYCHRSLIRYLPAAGGTPQRLGTANGLAANGATALHHDREGNLWIASRRGVTKIVSRRFASYAQKHGLREDEVAAILEVAPGALLLGHNVGLTYLTRSGAVALPFPQAPEALAGATRVMDPARDEHGAIWAALSSGGVARIDLDDGLLTFREAPSSASAASPSPTTTRSSSRAGSRDSSRRGCPLTAPRRSRSATPTCRRASTGSISAPAIPADRGASRWCRRRSRSRRRCGSGGGSWRSTCWRPACCSTSSSAFWRRGATRGGWRARCASAPASCNGRRSSWRRPTRPSRASSPP